MVWKDSVGVVGEEGSVKRQIACRWKEGDSNMVMY